MHSSVLRPSDEAERGDVRLEQISNENLPTEFDSNEAMKKDDHHNVEEVGHIEPERSPLVNELLMTNCNACNALLYLLWPTSVLGMIRYSYAHVGAKENEEGILPPFRMLLNREISPSWTVHHNEDKMKRRIVIVYSSECFMISQL